MSAATSFSILFPGSHAPAPDAGDAPACFGDLRLDQIVTAIVAHWQPYDLAPFFHQTLRHVDAVHFRQEVMRDLDEPAVNETIRTFAEAFRAVHDRLDRAEKSSYRYEQARWCLAAAECYCHAVERLRADLQRLPVASRGLGACREYLGRYVQSTAFVTLATDAATLARRLAAVRYALLIRGNAITVRHDEGDVDYSAVIEQVFEKFRRGAAHNYLVRYPDEMPVDHVQAQVLERGALLYPDAFGALDAFVNAHATFVDDTIARFVREIHFYVAYLAHIDRFRHSGLPFCYPQVSATSKAVSARDAYDLALARTLAEAKQPVVGNDFLLTGAERLLIVSGPNQGGKTTFARMFGQLHYLASLGCPVPAAEAHLFLADRVFTHFEREEHVTTLRGKLQDDLIRIHDIVQQATPASIVILNEIFASTTVQDALPLSARILEQLSALDLLGVCVTFLTELTSLNEKTVSVVSTIDPADPAIRTFRLVRRPADGLAYALALAEKHHVTHDWLVTRIRA